MPLTEYERYLRVPELLSLQKPEETRTHEDELLFQSVHQVEELWMKCADEEITKFVAQIDRDELEGARAALHRIYVFEKLMAEQMRLLETMAPLAYFSIRKGLGHGSGLESPGFNRLLRNSKKVVEAFERACERRKVTPEDLVRDPQKDRSMWAIAEAMLDIDDAFQNFRFRHLQLVKRIIGAGTPSLKGNPIELLENNAKKMFFPTIWRAREALFSDFAPGELKT
ncbi:Tryptophan 2,3-dioxygenase [Labilithrix luteola]|uniref:Tryptophan 2,3-dioxygenase n=1 Tax=Labilithrix luteola TaxID=1391654 RepID=A0A0K1QAS9_9BACT|nr:tryptophan 2,3-dioxygenase family protein [Labilithrix luteola]AKV02838.1 Tryptophan 2,3-dioxygenase [Labilithrix luteola]